jgi:hypothetical protein
MKERNRGCCSEDWRGNTAGVASGCFSNLFDITIATRVVHLWDMGLWK